MDENDYGSKGYLNESNFDMPLIYYLHGRSHHFRATIIFLITGFQFGLVIFMSKGLGIVVDDTLMRLVEDLEARNEFTWGEHIWRQLYDQINDVVSNHRIEHIDGLNRSSNMFPHICVGIYMGFQGSRWWIKETDVIPRALAWSKMATFTKFRSLFAFWQGCRFSNCLGLRQILSSSAHDSTFLGKRVITLAKYINHNKRFKYNGMWLTCHINLKLRLNNLYKPKDCANDRPKAQQTLNMLQTGIIVGGWDKYEGGKIYGIPLGGTIIEQPFAIGAWKDNVTKEEAEVRFITFTTFKTTQLVVKAFSLAIARDGASAGVVRTGHCKFLQINSEGVTRNFYPGDKASTVT
ncbi:proteasome 20S beta1 subunit [Artemisia annua]|uniref:Proteasome 20S beta1 subunit n=1 Tax=Artemisia annua TaxID=35608 RepID=A0A2U1LZF8_ARTAN|nr:proteasome 20S beta1 subunit [Artemisia annua]